MAESWQREAGGAARPAAGGPRVLERASVFLWQHARVLERRVFDRRFRGGAPEAVVAALRAYRNADGGLGHALEPDLRCPSSQPIFVDFALKTLGEAGARDPELARGACDFLSGIGDSDGCVPCILPDAREHPRAAHWDAPDATRPSLNPTASIAGLLYTQDLRHPWLSRATDACFARLAQDPPDEAHAIHSGLLFLQHAPKRPESDELEQRLVERLPEARFFVRDVPVRSYGLTPLDFAPAPDAPGRALFPDELLAAHLDDLAARQQDDGGWPLLWEPPEGAAEGEWRGRWTLEALEVLVAWGRL